MNPTLSPKIISVTAPESESIHNLKSKLEELSQRLHQTVSDLAESHTEIANYRNGLAKMKEREQALALGLLKAKNRLMQQHSSLQQEESIRAQQDQIQRELLVQIEKMQKLQYEHQKEIQKISKLFSEKEKSYRQENQALRSALSAENQRSTHLETQNLQLKRIQQEYEVNKKKVDQVSSDKEFWSTAYQRLSVESKEKTTELAVKLRSAYQEIQHLKETASALKEKLA